MPELAVCRKMIRIISSAPRTHPRCQPGALKNLMVSIISQISFESPATKQISSMH